MLHAVAAKGILRALLVWHRGAGKDKTTFNLLGDRAMRWRVGNYFYFFPTSVQARMALWDNIDNDGFRTINHVPPAYLKARNETEMQLELANGSTIKLLGLDDPKQVDRARGINPMGAGFSEYAFMGPYGWEVMQPRLEQNGGIAIFNTTPNGDNHAAEMWEMANTRPDWFVQRLTIEDTGLLTEADMDRLRAEGVPEERIQQEYYCSFAGVKAGSYFGKALERAEAEGRIGVFPHVPGVPVDTAWDWGVSDANVVWFLQEVRGVPRAIDYYEANDLGIEDHLAECQRRAEKNGWVFGTHFGPHDTKARGHNAETREDVALDLGFEFEVVIRPSSTKILNDQIDQTRRLIHQMCFDRERCKQGLSALRSYHREWDDVRKTYRNKPFHDGASHGADGLRTRAAADPSLFAAPARSAHTTRITHRTPQGSGGHKTPSTTYLGR